MTFPPTLMPCLFGGCHFPFRRFVGPWLGLLAALALSACDSSLPAAMGTEPGSGLPLGACEDGRLPGGRGQCGSLRVPENPSAPTGRQIELNIVRLPALASTPAPDALFVFVGGPGEAATDLAEQLPPLFREVNQLRDIVLVDQRGTGKSNPLHCLSDAPVDLSLPATDIILLQEQRLRECLTGYDADLRYYTTPFFVDDINAVREALNYERINLWGGSYGTRAALIYLRRHGHSVRSVVLDSVAPTAIQLPHYASRDANAALRRLFTHCAQNPNCQQRFGNLAERTRALIARLNESPRQIALEHPLSQKELKLHMDGELLAGLLRLAVYQRELGPLVPLAIDAAEQGDFRPFSLLLVSSEKLAQSISLGLQQTVLCAEDVTRPAPALAEAGAILRLDGVVTQMRDICEFWPRGILPPGYFEPVHSDKPVLLVSGELDPVTPPRWAELAAETLSNSRHIRVPGAHHIASHTGCMDELIAAFIKDPGAELDTACVELIQPLSPFISPAGPAMQLEEAADD